MREPTLSNSSENGDIGSRSSDGAIGGYPVDDWDRWASATKAIYPSTRWQRYETAEQAGWSKAALADTQRFSNKIGSAAVMVVFNGVVLAHWGQIERRFMCHSIRKGLLSALYGQAVEQGRVDLEETLDSLDIDDDPPLTDIEKSARVSDLLKSRSGVYLPAAYESQKAKDDRPVRGSHAPGSHWYYNNWDFNVLGTVFNQKTGDDVFKVFDSQLAKPLQMQDFLPRHGYYHFERQNSIHPAYPFRMSARDLARFGLLYLRKGQWQGRQLIPSTWVHESTRAYSKAPHYGGYGHLWWTEGDALDELGAYYAAGVGHRIYVIPRAQLVVVHRADTYRNWRRPVRDDDLRILVDKILKARIGPPVAEPNLVDMPEAVKPSEGTTLPKTELAAFCGEYRWNQGQLIIRRDNDRLEIESPRHGRFYLQPHSPGEFIIEDMEHRVEFDRDEAGEVTGLRFWTPSETMLRSRGIRD